MEAPKSKKVDHKFTIHGKTFEDPYYWLRQRENPEVLEHIKAENRYAEEGMKELKPLQNKLFKEIKGRIKENDMSVPYRLNGYEYYSRFEEGKEYAIHCRKELGAEKEEILVDENERALNQGFYQLGSKNISQNNQILAFGEDTLSRRIYTISFRDLNSGAILEDKLHGTTGSVAWSADNRTLYYSKKDPETLRSFQVFRHVLGAPQEQDELIYEEDDDTFYVQVYPSKSREFIFIESRSTLTSEFRFISSQNTGGDFAVFSTRRRGLEYQIDHYGHSFYILHNQNALNFKLSKSPLKSTSPTEWETIIDHRDEVLLEDMELFHDFMVLEERKEGLSQIRIIPWNNSEDEHYIDFEDEAYSAAISINPEFETSVLRYEFSSLTVPPSVYDYNMVEKSKQLRKRNEVVGGYNPDDFTSERIWVKVRDGEQVPVSIVFKKGFEKKGESPLLLYGYGSYGLSLDPYFSVARLSLLERGFAFALAHIRGGQEMGRRWYEDGKLFRKKNTFYDFIDIAQFLIENKYTSASHLYAMGGSAGGLLMGAVMNLAPDLWNGIVAQVPFVDVINTMLDESIPLTTGEYDEWGNPNEKVAFEYILSYSPYDNIERKNYPALLVTTGFHDSQVQYWEPAKWVAKLRELKTDSNPLYFVTDLESGHGGASGRFKRFKEVALEYAFLLSREGIQE